MIRTFIKTKNNKLSLTIPDKYIGRELEVIAFARDEEFEEISVSEKEVNFTVLHTNFKNYKFNRDEANER
ncbi:MAG: hypothetical protein P1P88_19520 [Bacteroidales bacterium]|nr:hypothetical protein [Bacteroidales bacterium]